MVPDTGIGASLNDTVYQRVSLVAVAVEMTIVMLTTLKDQFNSGVFQ